MDDFNYSIRKRQVHKLRLFDVRKKCNSAEDRYSTAKRSKAEENKYTDICEIINLGILNWDFGSAGRREFIFINNSELG
jgi:hypothetical protein